MLRSIPKYILFILVLTATTYPQEQKNIQIEKNKEGGFNIYDNSGKLLQEVSQDNTDSLTLEKLEYIFSGSDTLNNNKQPITIFNLQGNSSNWMLLIVAILGICGTFASGYFTNKWNKKAQIEQLQKQTKIQIKKEWLDLVMSYVSDFISETHSLKMMREMYSDTEDLKELKEFVEYTKVTNKKLQGLRVKLESILDKEDKQHYELLTILSSIDQNEYEKASNENNTMEEDIFKARELVAQIYQDETQKLISE